MPEKRRRARASSASRAHSQSRKMVPTSRGRSASPARADGQGGLQGGRNTLALALATGIVTVSCVAVSRLSASSTPLSSVEVVAWYSWLTAASTGLGAVPFLFITAARGPTRSTSGRALGADAAAAVAAASGRWHGHANAVASGMMLAASAALVWEALGHESEGGGGPVSALSQALPYAHAVAHPAVRTILGLALGWAFVVATKLVVDAHEASVLGAFFPALRPSSSSSVEGDAEEGKARREGAGLSAVDAKKMLLIVAVMTLHSATEGVGLGVSFGADTEHMGGGAGSSHAGLGRFMTATLAVHNVPEGLATCLVLIPRGVPVLHAALWAVATSLPQALLAVPSFLAIQAVMPLLPVGLGFAAGAMGHVALYELLAEAVEQVGRTAALLTAVPAALAMLLLSARARH
jgi:ZIP family zinc transporter